MPPLERPAASPLLSTITARRPMPDRSLSSSAAIGAGSSPQSPPTPHGSCRRRLTTISTLSRQASSVSATGAPRLLLDRECGMLSKWASTGNSSRCPSAQPDVTSSAWPCRNSQPTACTPSPHPGPGSTCPPAPGARGNASPLSARGQSPVQPTLALSSVRCLSRLQMSRSRPSPTLTRLPLRAFGRPGRRRGCTHSMYARAAGPIPHSRTSS